MEPTYTVLGTDGQQYGPVTAEELRGWVRESRIGGDTKIWRSDQPAWTTAAGLPELGLATPGTAPALAVHPAPVPGVAPARASDPELAARVKSGASWFYWLAALTLINSIAALSGTGWGFYLGLGITKVIDAVVGDAGTTGKMIALILDVLAAGLLVLFGVFAHKLQAWAFIAGLILLVLDGALIAFIAITSGAGSEWISLGFHVFALFAIFRAFRASRELVAGQAL